MRLPDGSVLMHGGRPYDPAKARAYYLRTRKLTGRKKGQVQDLNKKPGQKKIAPSKKKRATPKQRAEARQQITDLTNKLAKQKKALKEVLSGKKATARTSAVKAKASAKDSKKPPTASEKADASREGKKFRDKNQQQLKTKAKAAKSGGSSKGEASKAEAGKNPKAKALDAQISETTSQLNAAIKKYRALG